MGRRRRRQNSQAKGPVTDCTLENTFAKTLPKVNAAKALRISQVKGQRQPNEYVLVVSLFLFYKRLIKVRLLPHKKFKGGILLWISVKL